MHNGSPVRIIDGRDQLDRERDSFQLTAQLGHRLAVTGIDGKPRQHRRAALGEQAHRLIPSRLSAPANPSSAGTGMGGTGKVTSPLTPSTSRLVARIRNPGQARSRTPARTAHASRRCSQLSTTNRICRPASRSASAATPQRGD